MNKLRGETVHKLLAELGKMSADEIAAHLIRLGIIGRRREPANCPLALYIRQQLELTPTDQARIAGGSLRLYLNRSEPQHRLLYYALPTTLLQLIRLIDLGEFPELTPHDCKIGTMPAK